MHSIGTIPLETERLLLRRFTIEDAQNVFNNWASDKNTCRTSNWDCYKNVEFTKDILKKWIAKYDEGDYNWAVELKSSHEIIGNINAVNFSEKHQNCEIGYAYGSKYWNKGYATEALKRVIDFFLNDVQIHLVEAKHASSNPQSGRVLQKAGMQQDGILRDRRINKLTHTFDAIIYYSIIHN